MALTAEDSPLGRLLIRIAVSSFASLPKICVPVFSSRALISKDLASRIVGKVDESKRTEALHRSTINELSDTGLDSALATKDPKKVLYTIKSLVLKVPIAVTIYIAATVSSLALAVWWTIAHDDVSGGFTMGAYVWGVVIFPTGYWHWKGKGKVADEEDASVLEELGTSRTGRTENRRGESTQVE
jgi:hypothetical protein